MEVEKVGKNPSGDVINKKKWVILFSAFGVVIVGLVIAIVVVLVVRGDGGSEIEPPADVYDEAYRLYFDAVDGIDEKTASDEYTSEDILSLYKEQIDKAENEMVRALIEINYYDTLAFTTYDDSAKDEVINGLIEADEVLKTARSALAIVSMAIYYEDEELKNKYNAIADERMKIEIGEEDFDDDSQQ